MQQEAPQILGGPVWFALQLIILLTIGLSLFVLIDSLRPSRRADAAGRVPEPLWVYTVVMAVFVALLAFVQFVPGLQLAAAVPSIGAPFVLIMAIVYLLRVVFPKPTPEQLEASAQEMERKAQERSERTVTSEEHQLFDE